MQTPFVVHRYVTGGDFIARKKELSSLTDCLKKGKHILIYDSPKSGKQSLIQQGLITIKRDGFELHTCVVDLFNSRDRNHFCSTIINSISRQLSGYSNIKELILQSLELSNIELGSLKGADNTLLYRSTPDINIVKEVLELPYKISSLLGINIVLYIREFQNILHIEDSDSVLKIMESVMKQMQGVTFIITGSKVNAMKHIFEVKKYFYNFAKKITLDPIDEKDLGEYINKIFLRVGRVVQKEHIRSLFKITGGHPWYTLQLATICFNQTKGYLNENIIRDAEQYLMNTYSPYFSDIIDDLSNFQISFLKAVLAGHYQFSSAEVISGYGLNSSANVFRIKEALMKKEILTFDWEDKPSFINPLFRHWLENHFFI